MQSHYFANKGQSSQSYGFSSSHVWMWELNYKKGWALKNWCFWTVVLEKTVKSPLDCKEIQPVHPKGNQSWIFIRGTDVEAEAPILWPPDVKNWLIWKDPDAGKDWRQEEKGMTEDEMVGWYHWLNGHKFEKVPRVGDGQGSLACCSPWGCKNLDTTERLNWTERGFPGVSIVKNPPANARDAGDLDSIPGSGRSPGEGNGNPLQYSCLGNPMDRETCWATVHGVAKSWTLSNWTCTHTWHYNTWWIVLTSGLQILKERSFLFMTIKDAFMEEVS